MTGTQESEPLIPGALFWHLATPDFAGWNRYAICTSQEIRARLRNLGSPQLLSKDLQAARELTGESALQLDIATEAKVEKTDSWEILYLCWQFASVLVDNWFQPHQLMDSEVCGLYGFRAFFSKIKALLGKGWSKLCWPSKT